jgi:hypothetical protein
MLHKRPYVLAQREMERRQRCTRCETLIAAKKSTSTTIDHSFHVGA